MRRRQSRPSVVSKFGLVSAVLVLTLFVGCGAQHKQPGSAGPLIISPLPKTPAASPQTQISLLGIDPKSVQSVTVNGAWSGRHSGDLRQYSDGSGESFIPAVAFTPGERVMVAVRYRGVDRDQQVTTEFTVAREGPPLLFRSRLRRRPPFELKHSKLKRPSRRPFSPPLRQGKPNGGRDRKRLVAPRYVSAPTLRPVRIRITRKSGNLSDARILLTPTTFGHRTQIGGSNGFIRGTVGPLIVDSAGRPIFIKAVGRGQFSTDLNVQRYRGRQVLTWWQGQYARGYGIGSGHVVDSSYREVAQVHGGNGYHADAHELVLTDHNSALITAVASVRADLRSVHGPREGAVIDAIVEEIDLPTGLVKFEWHALGHIPLTDSHNPLSLPLWDPFHINSIARRNDNLLISSRYAWAIFNIGLENGKVRWTLGGRHSTFALGPGVKFRFQHHARFVPNKHNQISLFDNENDVLDPKRLSRGEVVALDFQNKRATLVHEYLNPPYKSSSQGDTQLLANGNVFIGWGAVPHFSEFDSAGNLLYNATIVGGSSYRAFRAQWAARPAYSPSIAVRKHGKTVTVFASWNGATEVAAWRVVNGPNAGKLKPIGRSLRHGFETAISVARKHGPIFAVEALDFNGKVIGKSAMVRG